MSTSFHIHVYFQAEQRPAPTTATRLTDSL
jgi:aromatic ring-cleaving dioxygenase